MKVDGNRIREIREGKGLTLDAVAKAADLGERRIRQVEAERSVNLNLNIAKAIARCLGVRLDDIAKGATA